MKATFFDGKKMILEKNYPDPDFNETLVRVDLAGICGTDLEILDGYMQYAGILGHEFVGTVKQSGSTLRTAWCRKRGSRAKWNQHA